MSDLSLYNLPYATSTCTVGFMYLFLPALTPILVLITLVSASTMYWGITQCKNDNMTVVH